MFADMAKKGTVHHQNVTEKSTEFLKAFREEVRLLLLAIYAFNQPNIYLFIYWFYAVDQGIEGYQPERAAIAPLSLDDYHFVK